MADEPRPAPGPDDRPRFFKTVNGWIAGLTGLVLAVAGLFTACDKLFPDDPKPPAASSTNTAAPVAVVAVPKPDSVPTKYTGDGGVTMEWDFDQARWELTDNGVEYDYEEVVSPDDTRVLGYDKANSAYLRWPLKGGMAEESKDDKASWTSYINLTPVEEPPAPAH